MRKENKRETGFVWRDLTQCGNAANTRCSNVKRVPGERWVTLLRPLERGLIPRREGGVGNVTGKKYEEVQRLCHDMIFCSWPAASIAVFSCHGSVAGTCWDRARRRRGFDSQKMAILHFFFSGRLSDIFLMKKREDVRRKGYENDKSRCDVEVLVMIHSTRYQKVRHVQYRWREDELTPWGYGLVARRGRSRKTMTTKKIQRLS